MREKAKKPKAAALKEAEDQLDELISAKNCCRAAGRLPPRTEQEEEEDKTERKKRESCKKKGLKVLILFLNLQQ